MRGPWSQPIEVELGAAGSYRVLTDTAEAAVVLLDFPLKSMNGEAYNTAKEVCLSVLGGKLDPDQAREAFLAAAKEAKVTVRLWA